MHSTQQPMAIAGWAEGEDGGHAQRAARALAARAVKGRRAIRGHASARGMLRLFWRGGFAFSHTRTLTWRSVGLSDPAQSMRVSKTQAVVPRACSGWVPAGKAHHHNCVAASAKGAAGVWQGVVCADSRAALLYSAGAGRTARGAPQPVRGYIRALAHSRMNDGGPGHGATARARLPGGVVRQDIRGDEKRGRPDVPSQWRARDEGGKPTSRPAACVKTCGESP